MVENIILEFKDKVFTGKDEVVDGREALKERKE